MFVVVDLRSPYGGCSGLARRRDPDHARRHARARAWPTSAEGIMAWLRGPLARRLGDLQDALLEFIRFEAASAMVSLW